MRKRIIFVVVALVLIASLIPFTVVSAQTAARVQVETKADGTGTAVPAQTIASGNSITVYAISRDASNNFIANVAADVWSLQNGTGGVVAADLVPSSDKKSAVFTGHAVGSAQIRATSGSLATTMSGVITVTAGVATKVQVETKADGTGIVVPAQAIASGSSITVYAISRDASNNYIANVTGDAWSLQNISGGVVGGDLIPSADKKSAVFTGHETGKAQIKVTLGTLTPILSGVIRVTEKTVVEKTSGFSPWGWLQGLKKGWQGLTLPPGWFKNGKADQDDNNNTPIIPQEKGNAKNNKNK